MEASNAQDALYAATVPPVTQDVVSDDEDGPPVSPMALFPAALMILKP